VACWERPKDENVKRTSLIRLGGLAPIVGGVIYAVVSILADPFYANRLTLIWDVSSILFGLSVMAVIVALHLLQSERYGSSGMLAFLVAFVGVALLLGSFTGGAFFGYPSFVGDILFPLLGLVGALAATIGIIALGIATLAARKMPWWCGWALIAGNPLAALVLFFVGLDFLYGTWPVVVPWVVVGYAVFLTATRQAQQPSRVR
jgi:hypothetical protein